MTEDEYKEKENPEFEYDNERNICPFCGTYAPNGCLECDMNE